jgi:chitinase
VHPLVDHVHLLTFDMRGEHQVLTGHQSNLFLATGDIFSVSADIAARGLVAAGVPRSKVVFGFAQRSRRWDGVPDRYRGHLQIARTIGRVGPTYGELAEGAFERNGFFRHWDDECQVPFLFDGKTFLSYDDERSVSAKAAHVREQGYGGLFCRDPGCDRSGALLGAAFRGLEDR